MPSFAARRVAFATPVYSRQPRDDEMYVMRAFSRHAAHCTSCADPFAVHRTGGTLCPKGHQRALDVAEYVYNKAGQAYSRIDREGSQHLQIEIPYECEPVRSLLKAMERGLRIMKGAPSVASYDRTYHVRARVLPPATTAARNPSAGLRLETAIPPAWAVETRAPRTTASSASSRSVLLPTTAAAAPRDGRGSMYLSDMAGRTPASGVRPNIVYLEPGPPVPPKRYYLVR